ncbi:MAG: DUF177 domain-containing protein [Rhodobacter sp.]|nr:DUF177 domain-containing protein [Rhodobacter sp.]
MSDVPRFSQTLRLADLKGGSAVPVAVEPGPDDRRAIADSLGVRAIRKLRLAGALTPLGAADWRLDATLGATLVQDCVVTLEPVTTRIDEPVRRTYLAEPPDLPDADEIEMPEDDSVERLPAVLDLGAVLIEALALALPPYPHAEGAEPLAATFTEPGKAAMSDDDAKPFAGLAGLRDRLAKDGDD